MPTLVLMRHAKSAWDVDTSDDLRLLAPRGERDADAAGEFLVGKGIQPDLVLVSPAARARLTWEHLSAAGVTAGEVRESEAIYDGDAASIVRAILDADVDGTVLVIGHSPTMAEVIEDVAARDDSKQWDRFDLKYPTSAIAVVDLPSYDAVGKGTLVDYVVPRG